MTISAASRSRVRAAALGLAIAGPTLLLTACDKPATKVTLQSGSKSLIVSPFDVDKTKDLCKADSNTVHTFHAVGGSDVLIDVPKDVANGGWFVSSFTVDSTCQAQSVPVATTTPLKEHAVRVSVPQVPGQSFFTQIVPVTDSKLAKSRTTWIVRVAIDQ